MADITITNLRIAPVHSLRVPTKFKAFCRTPGGFLLNDANKTAVSESSPYQNGAPFREWNLALTGTDFAVPGDIGLPPTTDSPDRPNEAR